MMLPDDLTGRDQWILWHLVTLDDGRTTKVPVHADGRAASITDPTNYQAYEVVRELCQREPQRFDGVGFIFTADDPFAGVDVDNCLDESGQLKAWARPHIEAFAGTYMEVSPSGTGIKIWAKGKLPGKGKRRKFGDHAIELYDQERFFAVTGNAFNDAPLQIEDHQADIEKVYELVAGGPKSNGTAQSAESKVPQGHRHDFLVSLAGSMRKRGMTVDAIDAALQIENSTRCEPPHDREHVRKIAESTQQWTPEADSEDWQEPIPLIAKSQAPLGSDMLPGALGDYAQALARHTETPVDLSLLATLGATSAALAGKIEVEAESGYTETAHIWVCALLESGNRKTAVIDAVRRPIDDYQDNQRILQEPEFRRISSERKTKLATIEKLRRNLNVDSPADLAMQQRHIADLETELPDEPHRITLTTTDTTAEALEELLEENGGRMAILSDEAGMFDVMAGRYGPQPNLDVFLRGHTGGRVSTHRRSRRSFIPHTYITMCMAPQPGVIQGMPPFMRDRGLLPRFLFAMPESPIGKRTHSTASIPPDVQLGYESTIKRLILYKPGEPVRLQLSDPAYREWKAFQRRVETLMADGGTLDRLRDWGGKLAGAALRVAAIFSAACSESLPPDRIEKSEIDRATALCAALIPHALAAFDLVEEDPKVGLAKRILRWLRRQQGPAVSRRDCFRALHRHFDQVSKMDAPLQVLAQHFYVRTETAKTGGRPSELIEINPRWRRDEDVA